MQLEHEFEVPVPVEQAWDVLLDVERIAPCMPGATVESFDGEVVTGKVKVKVGPIQVTYSGTARFKEKDEDGRRVVIDASGKEARGSGTANATIVGTLHPQGSSTKVTVSTDLAITGKPAQFGRGVMVEVGNKLLGQFATCLAQEISGPPAAEAGGAAAGAPAAAAGAPAAPEAAAAPAGAQAAAAARDISAATGAAGPTATTAPPPLRRLPESEPIDLLQTAGGPVLKRLLPLVAGLVVLVVVWRLLRGRRS
jgi:carbon monoxide dehydrogenase subunit G